MATLYLIEIYGPGSYSGSGSGMVTVDGITILTSSQPILPRVAQSAFILFLVPFVFGVAGVFRKENIYLALGSFCFGLAPILIYTLGVFLTSMLYFGITLPAFGVYAFNRVRKT